MKLIRFLIVTAIAAIFVGCSASAPPQELVDARQAYQQANSGQATQLVPAEVHKAKVALDAAEKAFQDDPDSYTTRDLAYIADRKAKIAVGLANSAAEKAATEKANKEFQTTQTEILKTSQEDLAASEKEALIKSEQLAAAEAALAKLEAKEEERGLVITLSGSVLFASNESTLLPAAQSKLDEVAEALLKSKDRRVTIEGHTDSQGSTDHNQVLGQQRADAVRSYIISRGYSSNLIFAQGIGEGRPIADNNSAEGRANNRRVEIVIDKK